MVGLQVKKISGKQYEHVEVCDRFEMKTMKDYDNLYLKNLKIVV